MSSEEPNFYEPIFPFIKEKTVAFDNSVKIKLRAKPLAEMFYQFILIRNSHNGKAPVMYKGMRAILTGLAIYNTLRMCGCKLSDIKFEYITVDSPTKPSFEMPILKYTIIQMCEPAVFEKFIYKRLTQKYTDEVDDVIGKDVK